jgi:hypothetical protein
VKANRSNHLSGERDIVRLSSEGNKIACIRDSFSNELLMFSIYTQNHSSCRHIPGACCGLFNSLAHCTNDLSTCSCGVMLLFSADLAQRIQHPTHSVAERLRVNLPIL